MSNPRSEDERAFGEALRREARAAEPEFAQPLHEEICRAVRRARADSPLADRAPAEHWGHAPRRWLWSPVALAAAVVLVAIVAWRSDLLNGPRVPVAMRPEPAGPRIQAAATEVVDDATSAPWLPALVNRAATRADSFLNEKLVTEQLAYLEHDARVLASAMTGGSLDSLILQPASPDGQNNPDRLPQ